MVQGNNLVQIREVNLLENKKIILWLNLAILPLLVVFGLFFKVVVAVFFTNTVAIEDSFSFTELLIFFISFFLLIIIHEGIHGLFFKLFNPKGKVKFGFKNGMAYATSPESFYSKKAFALICLAPFLLISVSLTLLVFLGILAPITYVSLATIHASSCVGDFYLVWLLIQAPRNCFVQDTEQGVKLYVKNS